LFRFADWKRRSVRYETLRRIARIEEGNRPWITDGTSEKEEGDWRGNYFIRRTPAIVEEWIAKFVTSD
jgi:hypothetical protein